VQTHGSVCGISSNVGTAICALTENWRATENQTALTERMSINVVRATVTEASQLFGEWGTRGLRGDPQGVQGQSPLDGPWDDITPELTGFEAETLFYIL